MDTMQPETTKTSRFSAQNRQSKIGILLLIALLILGVVLFLNRSKDKPLPVNKVSSLTASVSVESTGFVPSTLTVKKGTTVYWKNIDSDTYAQIASAPYPSHTSLPSLYSPQLGSQEQYSYTFNQAGTFSYQDQESPQNTGKIIVQN